MPKPTRKQLEFIEDICDALRIGFDGKTKQDASRFIDEHIDEFQRERDLEAVLYAAEMESAHGDYGCRDPY